MLNKQNGSLALPRHIAIIMDGNGRWAKKQGKPRIFGHKAGMDALQKVAIHAQKRGVEVLTVYAFSTENWSRPIDEVKFIMSLPIDFYERFVPVLNRENIQIQMMGERESVPKATLSAIDRAAKDTAANTGMILNFALNYGGRRELLLGLQNLAEQVAKGELLAQDLTESHISDVLLTASLPEALRDPDLVVRTSGEERLSNFLPWQSVYSELYFTSTLWPDFDEDALDEALAVYAERDRRYGEIKDAK